MLTIDVEALARAIDSAEQEQRQIPPLTGTGAFDAATAYAIQLANVARRRLRGETIVGMKVGLTSEPMQRMLGVNQPDYGHLFDTMRVPDGGTVPAGTLIQPRVEGEIAVVLAKPLRGPGITDGDVVAACAYVAPAIEIIDSRITDWKITLADTIADNGSSALFVLGETKTPIDAIDLRTTGMVLEKNGTVVGTGAGAAVLGASPTRAVAWLANALADFGVTLEAGHVVLPGALSAAVAVTGGDTVRADFGRLGVVSVSFS